MIHQSHLKEDFLVQTKLFLFPVADRNVERNGIKLIEDLEIEVSDPV